MRVATPAPVGRQRTLVISPRGWVVRKLGRSSANRSCSATRPVKRADLAVSLTQPHLSCRRVGGHPGNHPTPGNSAAWTAGLPRGQWVGGRRPARGFVMPIASSRVEAGPSEWQPKWQPMERIRADPDGRPRKRSCRWPAAMHFSALHWTSSGGSFYPRATGARRFVVANAWSHRRCAHANSRDHNGADVAYHAHGSPAESGYERRSDNYGSEGADPERRCWPQSSAHRAAVR